MATTESRINQPVEDCPCYRCTEPIYKYDDQGRRYVFNNLHGRLQPCEDCGHLKTEHRDFGTHGICKCWWCNDRAKTPESANS